MSPEEIYREDDDIVIELPEEQSIIIEMTPEGKDGRDGKDGKSATIKVGTVKTLPEGSEPTVVNSGTELDAIFDFGIPKGDRGDKGDKGNVMYATFEVDTTTGYLNMVSDEEYTGANFSINDASGELVVTI